MNTPRTTRWLVLLVLLSGAACWFAYGRMEKFRQDAATARADLAQAQRAMEEIAALQRQGASASLDTPELTAQLAAAARSAGLRDAPDHTSAAPSRVESTDYTQTQVFLHFGPVTLPQVVAFLHHLSHADAGAHVQQIELAVPDPASGQTAVRDLWDANAIVAYFTYSPAKNARTSE